MEFNIPKKTPYFYIKVDGSEEMGCPNFCRWMDGNKLFLMDSGHNVFKVVEVENWGTMEVREETLLGEDEEVDVIGSV